MAEETEKKETRQPRFEIEDVERLFRALVPAGTPDPFGRIEELLVRLSEDYVADQKETIKYRDEIFDELSSIKTRTFGILLLQVFTAFRFFFSLLPQGRVILILVAGMSLIDRYLKDDPPTLADVKGLVKKTGINNFIDKMLEEVKVSANEIAGDIQFVGDNLGNIMVSLGGDLESMVTGMEATARELESLKGDLVGTFGTEAHGYDLAIRNILSRLYKDMDLATQAGILADNTTDLIVPVLRGFDERVKAFPDLATKLVTLG